MRLFDALSAESERQGLAVSRYRSAQTPTAAEIQTLEASAENDSDLGDRVAAIKYMREASKVPASEALAYGRDVAFGRSTWRLPQELLDLGEAEAVADYFDRMARINLARRTDLREAAAKVRRGEKNL